MYCEHDDSRENCEIEITPEMVETGTEAILSDYILHVAEATFYKPMPLKLNNPLYNWRSLR